MMRARRSAVAVRAALAIVANLAVACSVNAPVSVPAETCVVGATTCERTALVTCRLVGGQPVAEWRSCLIEGSVCDPAIGCVACRPSQIGCSGADVAVCRADGSGWDTTTACDIAAGQGCIEGICKDLCAHATSERGYLGCEFRAVDLDNGNAAPMFAAAQQYAVFVSNPSAFDAWVVVEEDVGSAGAVSTLRTVMERAVPAGEAELFELPNRSLDGASSPFLNDGTHSTVTSNAYRIRSSVPVAVVQFNPLLPADTYSEDASLVLPTSAWGDHYTVVSWPQTIGPAAPLTYGTQFRSFVTVVAGPDGARVTVTFGPRVIRTAGSDRFPPGGPGDVIEVVLGPMGVLNVESDAIGADFTGTVVDATRDVGVFVGVEAADVPYVPGRRIAAADHLEEQLLPDRALGRDFVLHPLPSRSRALVEAFDDPEDRPIDANDEPDWVRMVNAGVDTAHITTELPPPFDATELAPGAMWEIRLDQAAHIRSDQPLSVIQLLAGQEFTGIPEAYPGGDPAMLAVPPTSLFRDRHVVLVPPHHLFDFIVIVAPVGVEGTIDGEPFGARCRPRPIDARWVVHQCQMGFPLLSRSEPMLSPGVQDDGVHTIAATEPVGVVVYGWDRYISYAYPGSLSTVVLL